MKIFRDYKDEIVSEIKELNDTLTDHAKKIEDYLIEQKEEQEIEIESKSLKEDQIDLDNKLSPEPKPIPEISDDLEIIADNTAETNEILLEIKDDLVEMNNNGLAGDWLVSITIILALGFHYFINQFSKW